MLLTTEPSLIPINLTSYTTLPRVGTTHRGLGPPAPIINKENAPAGMPTGQSDEGIFSTDVPASQINLTCVKSTETRQN